MYLISSIFFGFLPLIDSVNIISLFEGPWIEPLTRRYLFFINPYPLNPPFWFIFSVSSPINIIILLYSVLLKYPSCPCCGTLQEVFLGVNGPRFPGDLLFFSDLWDFRLIPNLLTGPWNPFPIVIAWESVNCPTLNTSSTLISFSNSDFA